MLVEKLFEALDRSMSHSELGKVITAAVNISNHSIEVNDHEVLVL